MMIEFLSRLRDRFRRDALDADLAEEMRLHLEMLAREEGARGLDPAAAAAAARRRFGNVTGLAERSRERWGFRWVDDLLQDVRYGLRGLRRTPVFTLAVTLTLALGMGATSAIYLVMQRTVRDALPVRQPERLAQVAVDRGANGMSPNLSYALFAALRDDSATFRAVAAHTTLDLAVDVGAGARRVRAGAVSAGFLAAMGADVAQGRDFERGEERLHGPASVVLGHALWTRLGERGAIGRSITINGTSFVIVGVAGRRFTGPVAGVAEELWVPLGTLDRLGALGAAMENPRTTWLDVFARHRESLTPAGLQQALERGGRSAVAAGLLREGERPALLDGSRGVTFYTAGLAEPLTLLLMATLLVLLIGCANTANLLLARAQVRQREMSVRLAIGAGRGRLIRQLLTEGLLLSGIGGLLALGVAYLGMRVLLGYETPMSGRLDVDASIDGTAIGFMALLVVATTIVSALVPAWQSAALPLVPALKGGGRARSARVRQALVVTQVALSLTLATGAALLLRSLTNLRAVDVGFGAQPAMLASIDLEQAGYDRERGAPVLAAVLGEVAALPGVRSVAAATVIHPAPGGSNWSEVPVEGYADTAANPVSFDVSRVSPGYFATLGIPLTAGRAFRDTDVRGAPRVAIVNQRFVQRYFAGRNPLGRHFSSGSRPTDPVFEIVGVVPDGKYRALREEAQATAYLPLLQQYAPRVTLIVQGDGDPLRLAEPVRRAIAALSPALPVYDVKTLAAHVATASAQERMLATLSTAFGGLALLLASLGLFGLMAYTVSQQTREIGVRMALGASAQPIVGLFVRRGGILLVVGILCGLGGVGATRRLLAGLLYGVAPGDPTALLLATGVLATAGLLAVWIPARRASRVDPVTALRGE